GQLLVFRNACQIYHIEDIQRWRVQAYLAMGKNEEALAAAKVYFNLARLDKTADALDTLLQCLKAARSNDPDLIERFKREQIEGALLTRQPNLYDSQHSVLASIKVPQAEMEEALAYV